MTKNEETKVLVDAVSTINVLKAEKEQLLERVAYLEKQNTQLIDCLAISSTLAPATGPAYTTCTNTTQPEVGKGCCAGITETT